jgi:hypothetical protein
LAKGDYGDLLAHSHNILNRWKIYFCQLLNVHGINDVRQTEVHTAESLVPEPSSFEVKIATEKLKRHKSPSIDQIPAEMNQAGSNTLHSDIKNLFVPLGIKAATAEEGIHYCTYL